MIAKTLAKRILNQKNLFNFAKSAATQTADTGASTRRGQISQVNIILLRLLVQLLMSNSKDRFLLFLMHSKLKAFKTDLFLKSPSILETQELEQLQWTQLMVSSEDNKSQIPVHQSEFQLDHKH